MIIDTSYFLKKDVFIPNAVAQPSIGSNTPTSVSQLNAEIDQREYEFTLSFLGDAQNTELYNQFNEDGTWKDDALQKWKDLVEGVEFEGKKWNGLRYTIGTQKISIIAYYVYFFYLKEDFATYSTTGIQVAQSENAISQLPNEKQASAWNKFVNMYDGGNIQERNYSFSRNWNGLMLRWSSGERNQVSLLDFIRANQEDYNTNFLSYYGLINSMNL